MAIPEEAYSDGTYVNYKLGNYDVPAVQVYYNNAWVTLPMHKDGTGDITTTLVNSARNSVGTVIGQQIGRTQGKIEGLVFPFLYAHEWASICQMFKLKISRKVRYFDMELGKKIERTLYINDRTATRFAYRSNGDVAVWKDCSLSLIDVGIQSENS